MLRGLGSIKRLFWWGFHKHGSLYRSSRLLVDQTRHRTLHSPVSRNPSHRIKPYTPCSVSSARLLSSGPEMTSDGIGSHFPDVDIPVVPLADFLFSRCDQYEDNIAVSDYQSDRQYTYKELKVYARRVASALHAQGFRKGDVITLFTPNLPDFTLLLLAAVSLGVIVCPVNPTYKAGELSHILTGNRSRGIFTIPQLMPIVQDAIQDPSLPYEVKKLYTFSRDELGTPFFGDLMEDQGLEFPGDVHIDPLKDVAILPYTSGVTGMPKGVMLTHYNLVANVLQFRDLTPVHRHDKVLGLLPLFHIFGLAAVQFSTLYGGGHFITLPRFQPDLFLTALQEHKISIIHVVPPIILFLAKQPVVAEFDLSALQGIICGAAPLGEDLIKECQDRLGVPIYQGYGLTETSPVTNVDSHPGHLGTIGHLVPNTRAKLVNPETGEVVGVGEMGEYCVKGPQVMLGYYHNQEATDKIIDPDGWLHTGDLGVMREDGFVIIKDRLKELIKYRGFQVPPAELENVLLTHPAVQDAAVIGVPREGDGELPKAFLVVRPNTVVSPQDIIHFVQERVAPHKQLRGGVEFVGEIPKTASGKILRRILKAKS